MDTIRIIYSAGQGIYTNEGVDYMADETGEFGLYAEMVNPTWDEEAEKLLDECATYDELKEVILTQAEEKGIDIKLLHFMYD